MLIYEVYYKDYKNSQANKIAILVERRRDPNRQNGLKWVRRMFGDMFRDTTVFSSAQEEKINIG
jgi:hypothetical protein